MPAFATLSGRTICTHANCFLCHGLQGLHGGELDLHLLSGSLDIRDFTVPTEGYQAAIREVRQGAQGAAVRASISQTLS